MLFLIFGFLFILALAIIIYAFSINLNYGLVVLTTILFVLFVFMRKAMKKHNSFFKLAMKELENNLTESFGHQEGRDLYHNLNRKFRHNNALQLQIILKLNEIFQQNQDFGREEVKKILNGTSDFFNGVI